MIANSRSPPELTTAKRNTSTAWTAPQRRTIGKGLTGRTHSVKNERRLSNQSFCSSPNVRSAICRLIINNIFPYDFRLASFTAWNELRARILTMKTLIEVSTAVCNFEISSSSWALLDNFYDTGILTTVWVISVLERTETKSHTKLQRRVDVPKRNK